MAAITDYPVELPPKLIPVFNTPDKFFRCSHGGRGSAKTRTFAKMAAFRGVQFAREGREGIILCAREFMNSLDDSSMAEVKAAIASDPFLSAHYDVGEKYIRTKCGKVSFSFIGLRRNLNSIKSKALILLCWIDEAESVSEVAWVKLIPTIREEGAECWICWNPERKGSPTDLRFRQNTADCIVVEMNWRDNPYFPLVLRKTRLRDLTERPDQYDHIWEGAYASIIAGAYYAKQLVAAKQENRICRLARDPLMAIRAYHDIGGAGRKADAYSIWIAQFINREIRVLNHYTSQGQSLDFHVQWMRDNDYEKAEIFLPHDGDPANDAKSGKSYADHWEDAGFSVDVIPNQGMGAAMLRVNSTRRVFPRVLFNEATTEQGREALGSYHAKLHPVTGYDMGPDHDDASHDADAFGLMCCHYEEPLIKQENRRKARRSGGKRHTAWAM